MLAGADAGDDVRAILAAAGASGTWDWDVVAGELRIDGRFAELYGLDPADAQRVLPTRLFFKAIHPEDQARIKIAVTGMTAGAERFSKEFRVVAPNGETLWMHGRGQAHFDDQDVPVRFTGLLVDVTERKRTEERLRIAQSAGGVGTFEYSDGYATATVSGEFCRLLGLHPATTLPVRTINSVLKNKDEPDLIPEAHCGGPPETLDGSFCVVRSDDGEERWIARRGEIVRDKDNGGYRLIGVIYDVTATKAQEAALRDLNETLEMRVEQAVAERQAVEDALRQAQKMEAVGNLTGGIAHDFNNLLTIIIGNIDTVIRRFDPGADPRAKRALENALKGADRAAALVQRLLAFSRRQPLDPKSIDIERLLTGMADLLTRSISESIAIQIVPTADLWTVEADPNQLENVILNLAVNARDAMPDGGALTIEARNVTLDANAVPDAPAGDYVAISVVDDGIGMSPETVEKVFDPFFTTKEVGKGTGLGLSMVYGFVKQSGGHIQILSTPGCGTTITLFLQRYLGHSAALAADVVPVDEQAGGHESILVVEDDDDVRAYTVGILRELGYRVIEAHDGSTALKLLERADPVIALLLTDIVMPKMSGSQLADAAKALQPGLGVLYTSGYTRDAITRDGRLEAGVDLLTKPFTYTTLASKVRDLLDGH
ncbi:Sensor histidine kinase RcsC [Sphingobium sp. AntQ-1]|uniref:hybrid sensor histidine kinase/response regulator n=1 Tax=Sphingobium sp. AntQ-1 TaxID=2930091 RepID=UPI00234F3F05|nr:hybrid sensor histidine kinase/response regulator [Sphingobium sp. AntQ-1]WCP12303.1 Sensor histidine kinase RcsC [Sphingobium sp. AntQ-1]